MLSAGLSINVIRDGRKIFVIELKQLSIRFVRSNNYFDGDEFYLANMFEIPNKKLFFPFRFKEVPASTEIPHSSYFFDFKDSDLERELKINFVKDLQNQKYKWIFEKELIFYAEEKVRLLVESFLKFIEESFYFQKQLQESDIHSHEYIHPLAENICTISALIFKIYRFFYMNKLPLFSIKNEYGLSCKHVSAQEYEFSKFYEYKYPEKNYRTMFSHKEGQKIFKESMPDLYSEKFGEIVLYNGCFWHAHSGTTCLINSKSTPQTKHPVFNKTFEEINLEFDRKMALLLQNNPNEINSIKIVWECQYLNMRKLPEFKKFLQDEFKQRPMYRLSVRDSIRGGMTDCYALKWLQTENLNENFFCLDMNGMYPYIGLKYSFPFGKYDIIVGNDTKHIIFKNENFFYRQDPQPLCGLMLVTIIPPKNLFYPFLPYKLKNGRTVFSLCVECAEKNLRICNHEDNQRALTSVYYISEIKFAISLGYKLLEIFECYYFEKSAYILQDFIRKLCFLRLKHTNIFKNCSSETEKNEYCQYLNDQMELQAPFLLTPENITPNEKKKQFYKLLTCSIFGKLEQRSDKPKTMYVNSQTELEDIYFSDLEILNVFCVNENTCELEVKPNIDKILPNRETNIAIGGQLVSYARQLMYETIMNVDKIGKVFYVDTDSCFFSIPKNESIPLLLSDSFGHFKQVYDGNITSFFCLGPKNYCINYETSDNQIKTITKIKGLSLSSYYNKNEINDATFNYFITKHLSDEIEKKQLAQLKFKKYQRNQKNSVQTLQLIQFSNSITNRRVIMNNCKYVTTFPYGNENIN
jgi:G:T-mismatch repair DNA endonuclease (very short patch repair protein)